MTDGEIQIAGGQRYTVGLVGGLSWEATALYYRLLNQAVAARLGGHHNARSLLATVDFEEVLRPALADDWDGVARPIVSAALAVERAGADCVLLTANTAHLVADRVTAACSIPLIHIVDAVGEAARAAGLTRLGLVGTKQTLGSGLYDRHLSDRFGIDVVLPETDARDALQTVILDELTRGEIRPDSRARCLDIVESLAGAGAQGVVLACTELPLLMADGDASVPLLDSTWLHVGRALEFAFGDLVLSITGDRSA